MKNYAIGLLVLGFASLGYSQDPDNEMDEVQLSDVVVTPINLSYIAKVQDKSTPEPVIKLENKAARYNVKNSPVFDEDFDAYEVIFSQTNGSIMATYDGNGKITSTKEKYKDLTLPFKVRNAIYKKYPGWTIHSDVYVVSYKHDGKLKQIYEARITKDNMKKRVKCDTEGTLQ